MTATKISGARIAGIGTCVPSCRFDNLKDTSEFTEAEVKKVVALAGVRSRRTADDSMCSSDLCIAAANCILESLGWERGSIDGLIMVTQSPDYFLPSTACVVHKRLGLSDECAAFDIGLGCSGYPYGLWVAAMMLKCGGLRKVLLLHGETPSRFAKKSDRSVSLLFGDTGSATAMEAVEPEISGEWFFKLHTDGSGYEDMIIEGGGFRNRFCDDSAMNFVRMNGANIFNFTIKRVPSLIQDTLDVAKTDVDSVNYFIFHQSNQFIIKHLIKKMKLPAEKVPIILKNFGNTGGASVPLTITRGGLDRPVDYPLRMMLLGYGVGLSWGSALIALDPQARIEHVELNSEGN